MGTLKKQTYSKLSSVSKAQIGGMLLGLVAAFLVVAYLTLPDISMVKSQYPVVSYTKNKEGHSDTKVEWFKQKPARWVKLKSLGKPTVGAVVTTEDWAFYSHSGVDFTQIFKVIERAVAKGHLKRGASTITQQVVKNLFLSQERSLLRKLKEWILAFQLESALPKSKILELYFNIVEWGPGISGIGQASNYYFDIPASDLNPKEAAFLAMLLPSPTRYGVSFREGKLSDFAKKQIQRVLHRTVQAHFLTMEEKDFYASIPLYFEKDIFTEQDFETTEPEIDPEKDSEEELMEDPELEASLFEVLDAEE